MEKSALQIERAAYQPKLPKALRGAVKVKEGEPTHSVDNQEEIKKLFPNTYGMPIVEFEPCEEAMGKKGSVLAFGSLYYLKEVKQSLLSAEKEDTL